VTTLPPLICHVLGPCTRSDDHRMLVACAEIDGHEPSRQPHREWRVRGIVTRRSYPELAIGMGAKSYKPALVREAQGMPRTCHAHALPHQVS